MIRFSRFYIIELTFKCNTQCEYCYLRENRTDFFNKEMDFNVFKNAVDSIAANYILTNQKANQEEIVVVLHGGEPLLLGLEKLKKYITYMVSTFDKYKINNRSISIQTNGILLEKNIINFLRSKGIRIGISYDGLNTARIKNPEINKNILNNIESLRKNHIPFGVISVIHKKNFDYFKNLTPEKDKNFRVKLLPVYSTLDDKDLKISLIDFFNTFEKPKIDTGEAFTNNCSANIGRIASKILVDLLTDNEDNCRNTCNFRFCGSGTSMCAIEPTGEIATCDRFNVEFFKEFKLKNLNDYDFLGVSQLKRAVNFNLMLHNMYKKIGCDFCYARVACSSDCQALHYSTHKQFGIDTSNCLYTKTIYDYIYNNLDKILDNIIRNQKQIKIKELRVLNIKPRVRFYIREKFGVEISLNKEKDTITFEEKQCTI